MSNNASKILSAVTLLFLFSCSHDRIDCQADRNLIKQELTFKAGLIDSEITPDCTAKSSAVLDNEGKITDILWSPNDAINVFFVSGEGSAGKFTNTTAQASKTASFKGSIEVFTGTNDSPVDDQMFWAVYPYSESNSYADNAITFTVPATQSSGKNTFSDGQWPTMARSSGLNLGFYSICSGIKFKVSQEGVTSVTFTNKDGGAINGSVKVGWDGDGKPLVTGITGGSNSVVVTPPSGTTSFTPGNWYFVVFAPVTMSSGIEVFYKTSNSHCTYTNSGNLQFKRNEFSILNCKDTDYQPDCYKLVTSEPSDWSGKYIFVSADKNLIFNGSVTNGSNTYTIQSGDKSGDDITRNCSGYEFTVSKEGSVYYLYNTGKGKYLYSSYSDSGCDGTTGLCYSDSKKAFILEIQANGTFGFKSSSNNQYLYYKSSISSFKFGTSHEGNCVYLYKWDDGIPPSSPALTEHKYVKITSAPSTWDGAYLFVDENSSKAFAAFSDIDNHAVEVTIADGTINSNSTIDKYALTVTATGETHVNLKSPSYNVQNSDGKYVYYSEGVIHTEDSGSKYSSTYGNIVYNHCFDYKSGDVEVRSSGNYTGFSTYYLGYSSSSFNYIKDQSRVIQLYKFDGPNKQNQTINFGNSSVTWTLGSTYIIGGTYDPQTFTGAQTTTSYSSSNSEVATIEGGKIRIAGPGKTKITANAVETDSYYAGSASYVLTIIEEGVYNLENSYLSLYLDDADVNYTDANWGAMTVMNKYDGNTSSSNRKDFPAPVTLTVSGSGSKTVSVYTDSGKSQKVMEVTTTSTTADIYNLIPNKTYYYSVTNGASGSFKTSGIRRMLKVSDEYNYDHANNCRDLGGMTTTDGKTLKYELVYRGSNMDATTDDEKTTLTKTLGIKTDIDLRSGGTSPWSTVNWGVTYKRTEYNSWQDLQNTTKINDTFTNIINSVTAGQACYIHCKVGADRTGYICLLLEAVLGVSQKDCSMDYELTSMSCVGARYRNGGGNVYFTQGMNYIEGQTGSSFKAKAEKILTDAGITSQQITNLRDAMLTSE